MLGAGEILKPNIQVYAKFWNDALGLNGKANVTHPLITYAELIATDCHHNFVAANEIAAEFF